MKRATLGTLLRHLIELLDGAVEQSYRDAGLDYRPRYTPIVRALLARGQDSIRAISRHAGITHSAASQTIAHMSSKGLVRVTKGDDARETLVELTPAAHAIIPSIQRCWQATETAARDLEIDIGLPLAEVIRNTIRELDRKSFGERIRDNLKDNTS